jgi:Protein of unknown function (DUF402)
MWSRGDVVALRDIWFGVVWRGVAGVVLEDGGSAAVFWIPVGAVSSYPVDVDGREIRIPQPRFARGARRTKKPVVVVCETRAPWTLWHFFREDGTFDHWYVNFEHYLGRSAIAYDSVDHKLDLIVRSDGGVEWKDEDELEQAARLGLVDAAAVRADAERVLAQPPWPTGWERFRPDREWPVPELPEGWDVF